MYDELVKRLRNNADHYMTVEGAVGLVHLLTDAADAIEKLWKMYLASEADATNLTGWLAEEHAKHLWIPVGERLPEEFEYLDWHEDMMIRFASVWCCDANTGTINVRNRFQHKITGIQFLDQNIQDTDWHWSKSWWEPTHWMPIVPLPEPPKEEHDG